LAAPDAARAIQCYRRYDESIELTMIYLDHNSTSPLLPEAAAAMTAAEAEQYANPASQHAEGRRANRALQNAREQIAQLLGANLSGQNADRLIFTSGGTEANNLALASLNHPTWNRAA
jgi:cysteine desulfurase